MAAGALARGFAGGAMVETAEGPVTMAETPGKGFAVLTRLPSGRLGFRQLVKVAATGPVELVRLVLDNGHAVVLGADHPCYRVGMEEVPAGRLVPGDRLETAFRYAEGYVPPDVEPARGASVRAVRRVEPAGAGKVFAGTVRDTHVLYLTAGILCAE
jgi:hypothetical protein